MAKSPPPPPKPPGFQAQNNQSLKGFSVSTGKQAAAQRVLVYGTGGAGKTSLAAGLIQVGKRPLILDMEDGSRALDVARVEAGQLTSLAYLREALRSDDLWHDHDVVVIDSLTKAEDLAMAAVCEEAGARKIEEVDGGYGKGYRRLYETILMLLSDLDRHIREGRDVVLVAHDTKARVPNPTGEDYIRYEPRLYHSDKASVRERIKEWADHVLAVMFDLHVNQKTGKAQGGGTRTIHPVEQPAMIAKSRTLKEPVVYHEGDAEIWRRMFTNN